MNLFQLTLRVIAAAMIAAASCHAVLGVFAERILDPALPPAISDYASLDSQNRFYGTMFGTAGVALWICAADLQKYDPILRCLLWGFLVAAIARLGAVLRNGWPSSAVTALLALELVAAPVVLLWHAAVRRRH